MEPPFSKPRVFLSHSQKDAEFIERLANDLRRSQIDPWLFTYEIRHGRPWMDEFFRYGMPTCDAIIAYLTESSLSSPVVAKEIDAGLLQKLSDSNVAFLPYVNDTKIRSLLRTDIQAIQTPVWNEDNYFALLPIVVSEIWRSYLERTVSSAIKEERLKRVEAELELEKYKNQLDDIFSNSENKEFEFIWSSFNHMILFQVEPLVMNLAAARLERSGVYKFTLHLASVVALLSDLFGANSEYEQKSLRAAIARKALGLVDIDTQNQNQYHGSRSDLPDFSQFTEQLLVHGLIEKFTFTSLYDGSEYLEHRLELSKKYFRFRFWMTYRQKLPERIRIEHVKEG